MNLGVPFHFAVRDSVEKNTQISFPGRKEVRKVRHNDALETGVRQDLFDVAEVRVLADDRLDPGVLDHVFDLEGSVDRGNGYQHGPDFLDGQKADDPLDAVGDIDHHPVALLDAQVQQGPCKPLAQFAQSAIGERLPEVHDGRPVRIGLAHPVEPGEGQFVVQGLGGEFMDLISLHCGCGLVVIVPCSSGCPLSVVSSSGHKTCSAG